MVQRICLAVALIVLVGLLVVSCTPAPRIPHPSEGLTAVDCLACHELGLKGATTIHESHLDDEGLVQYDNCDCHQPAPAEEQTPWKQALGTWHVVQLTGTVLIPVGLTVSGVLLASRRARGDLAN
jgi:hypothetical protein